MVRSLARAGEHLEVALRVEGRLGTDLVEEVGRHRAGAGEGGEHAARTQKLHREEVDVLVAARRAHEAGLGVRELRRVEHDEVERAPLVAVEAQLLEDVRLHELALRAAEVDAFRVLARKRQRLRARIHMRDGRRTARARHQSEAARVGETVEHVRRRRVGGHGRAEEWSMRSS